MTHGTEVDDCRPVRNSAADGYLRPRLHASLASSNPIIQPSACVA